MLFKGDLFKLKWIARLLAVYFTIQTPVLIVFGPDIYQTQEHLAVADPLPSGLPVLVNVGTLSEKCREPKYGQSCYWRSRTFLFIPNDIFSGTLTTISVHDDGMVRMKRNFGVMYLMIIAHLVLIAILVVWWRSRDRHP